MNLPITEQMLREITEDLEMGATCYVDKNTGEVLSIPEGWDSFVDRKLWQDIIDKIDQNWEDYWVIRPMESWDAFEVMEDFVDSLEDSKVARRLTNSLQHRKSFQQFKRMIHESDLQKEWFAYKLKRYADYIRNTPDKGLPDES